MSKPKTIEAYPPRILELAIQVGEGKSVSFRSKDKRMLKDLRLSFYGFRKAVEREGARNIFPRLGQITTTLNTIVGPEGSMWEITFMPVDNSPLATFLEANMTTEAIKPIYQPNVHSTDIDVYEPEKLQTKNSDALVEELLGIRPKKPTA